MEIYGFPGTRDAPLNEVGGKGWSLIQTSAVGLPVPPGYVLPVSFFVPWLVRIKNSDAWQYYLCNLEGNLARACSQLKEMAYGLQFSDRQKVALARITSDAPAALWAVRSSSPEEDLEGSSFAGGYETILGVNAQRLEDAVRRAFASCLDFRIVVYKRQNGFDVTDPKIAVVVQRQLASEISGVGFSLNPLTNYYDEAVFNANWGLGETVVSGEVTPDTFIVNKVTRKTVLKQPGKKEKSIWLLPFGSTAERADPRHEELTLGDRQLRLLTDLICQLETFYKKPIDIEWAFAEGQLYLLQARPITGYVPLAPVMVTAPGARRHLFLDATISVQAVFKPLSPMGSSILETAFKAVGKRVGFSFFGEPQKSLGFACAGRIYLNLSKLIGMIGKDRLAGLLSNMDPLAAATVKAVDEPTYKASGIPIIFFVALRNLLASAPRILSVELAPQRAHQRAQSKMREYELKAGQLFDQQLPLRAYILKALDLVLKFVTDEMLPVVGGSRAALARMKAMAASIEPDENVLRKLEQGLPHNVTTQMGLALYQISLAMPRSMNVDTFLENWRKGVLPPDLAKAWQDFIARYGHRGPGELDIASPRYRDNPRILVEQLVSLAQSSQLGGDDNPLTRFERAASERQATFETICSKMRAARQMGKLKSFQTLYRVVVTLAGYRETPKFYLIYTIDLIRRRLLEHADTLLAAGRIDSQAQVFDLTFADEARASEDPAYDVRAAGNKNRVLIDRLSKVPLLPTLIDSRGLILRSPPRVVRAGEVSGTPISPGIARGKIKVLHTADEKPLERGEILVARATDPGWTPLFVNAAAVILEIGGMLQHGALVAREYGLPCVSGIPDATTLWEDGTMVEVDGNAGIIRTLTM